MWTREEFKAEYRKRRDLCCLNTKTQMYKNKRMRLIVKKDYSTKNAKAFIVDEESTIWISNMYLSKDGTLKPDCDLDHIFNKIGLNREVGWYLARYG